MKSSLLPSLLIGLWSMAACEKTQRATSDSIVVKPPTEIISTDLLPGTDAQILRQDIQDCYYLDPACAKYVDRFDEVTTGYSFVRDTTRSEPTVHTNARSVTMAYIDQNQQAIAWTQYTVFDSVGGRYRDISIAFYDEKIGVTRTMHILHSPDKNTGSAYALGIK
jgi:hypothetical protein